MSKVKVTEEKLQKVMQGCIELIMRKNKDYGDAWQKHGIVGVGVRISDKAVRLETLSDGREALVVDEDINETLRDVLSYCALGLLYLKENPYTPPINVPHPHVERLIAVNLITMLHAIVTEEPSALTHYYQRRDISYISRADIAKIAHKWLCTYANKYQRPGDCPDEQEDV